MHEKSISLDSRLKCIAELIGKCDHYADSGCDHGRLGAFLLQHHWVNEAFLTDISDASLQKARTLIRLIGLDMRAHFLVCDGLEGLETTVDAIVIAGMGGTTIASILEKGKVKIGNARLILQANVAIPELRERLSALGYRISDEKLVRDGRRFYIVICAERGSAEYGEIEKIAGPVLVRNQPEGFVDYANYRLGIAKKARDGAVRGGENVSELEREIRAWEACLNDERS